MGGRGALGGGLVEDEGRGASQQQCGVGRLSGRTILESIIPKSARAHCVLFLPAGQFGIRCTVQMIISK